MPRRRRRIHRSTSMAGDPLDLFQHAMTNARGVIMFVMLMMALFGQASDAVVVMTASVAADVYAIGDCAGAPWLAHKASHEGIHAAEHIAGYKTPNVHSPIPGCTNANPQVASVYAGSASGLASMRPPSDRCAPSSLRTPVCR